ncbi:helix-turn-helix domain-containing protein [Peptoniphilus sp. MSJ-1]|uniref:Helix-turn-helix domain-containing protein n=1 Tax=Peptoniphilus ovalis TaxID=2841503 RepID=A0ABS6FH00_9FIRM|nr:NadS family protein [Peptoniphilus ovalis]MBU5668505.1 helix-turn-helix domain-containing protein [Peptoniphilus ovalis]
MSFYEDLRKGLNEAIDYHKGNKSKAKVKEIEIQDAKPLEADEIKNLRNSLKLTQKSFANLMNVSNKTVESWERGTNKPSGSSQRLLNIFINNPEIIDTLIFEK